MDALIMDIAITHIDFNLAIINKKKKKHKTINI